MTGFIIYDRPIFIFDIYYLYVKYVLYKSAICHISAVVVRYLTGRYLSEYAKAPEMTYERTVHVDGIAVPLKVTDISGKVGLKLEQNDFSQKYLRLMLFYLAFHCLEPY